MAKVMFKRIEDSADIDDTPIVDGQFIVTKDGKIYIDYGETRSEISGAGGGGSSAPVGTISQFAGNTIPDGWLLCDGSAISRTTYAQLFAKIGTTYGTGDGSTTFNVPNFNGRVPVGLDTTQTEFDTLGETGGEKTIALTTNEIPSHSHGIGYAMTGSSGSNTAIMSYQPSATFATDTAGGGQAHNNLQPYETVNFIIKALNITEATGTVDSLPIGSILDYDGDTAPEGYIQVQPIANYVDLDTVEVNTDTSKTLDTTWVVPETGTYILGGIVILNYYGADGRDLRFNVMSSNNYLASVGGILNINAYGKTETFFMIKSLTKQQVISFSITNSVSGKQWAFNGGTFYYAKIS